jgi:hypothetical protein
MNPNKPKVVFFPGIFQQPVFTNITFFKAKPYFFVVDQFLKLFLGSDIFLRQRSHICSSCSRKFRFRQNMLKHKLRVHNNTEIEVDEPGRKKTKESSIVPQ